MLFLSQSSSISPHHVRPSTLSFYPHRHPSIANHSTPGCYPSTAIRALGAPPNTPLDVPPPHYLPLSHSSSNSQTSTPLCLPIHSYSSKRVTLTSFVLIPLSRKPSIQPLLPPSLAAPTLSPSTVAHSTLPLTPSPLLPRHCLAPHCRLHSHPLHYSPSTRDPRHQPIAPFLPRPQNSCPPSPPFLAPPRQPPSSSPLTLAPRAPPLQQILSVHPLQHLVRTNTAPLS